MKQLILKILFRKEINDIKYKIKFYSEDRFKRFRRANELEEKDKTQSLSSEFIGHQSYGQMSAYEDVLKYIFKIKTNQ